MLARAASGSTASQHAVDNYCQKSRAYSLLVHEHSNLNGVRPRTVAVAPCQHKDWKAAPRQVSISYRQSDELLLPQQTPLLPLPVALAPNLAPAKPAAGSTAATTQHQQARTQLKVIGLGLRGISSVNRLIGAGGLPEAEFWALDSDKRVLAGADASARVLEVGPGDEACLSAADLQALSGGAAGLTEASSAPDGHAGAVFVLGSAFGSPGGSPMLLQLVRHLRRQGFFVAAALTRPFEFEGARRLEAADALISTMEEVAHLVVVIAQGVLTRASAELTMGQAQAIADNTLVYTVQSTLWALRAPEILKVSHGAFLWHGRDLRNIKRPLFPPMMNLLSCPGHATLGRGQAALPLPLLQQAGLASALSTLAEDAVKAASESPFLDNKLESATGVLCVLRVPPSALGVAGKSGGGEGGTGAHSNTPLVADNHKEYALRSAVQVAAMTVRELVGPHCHDIIVCPQLCHDMEADYQQQVQGAQQRPAATPLAGGTAAGEEDQEAQRQVLQAGAAGAAPPLLVRVEVSLLVLESIEEAAEARAVAGQKPGHAATAAASNNNHSAATAPSAASPTASTARDRMSSVIGTRSPSAPRRPPTPPRRLPTPTMTQGIGATASIFTGRLPGQSQPQQQHLTSSTSPLGSAGAGAAQPSWSGAAGPAVGAAAGRSVGIAGAAGSSGVQAPASAAGAPSAAAAAVAADNLARKQARLAAMSAMSALAGGSATAAHSNMLGGGGTARGGAATAAAGGGAGMSARGLPMYPQQPALQHQPPQQHQQQLQLQQQSVPAAARDTESVDSVSFPPQQIPRMAESLVTSLVAQSLDLPPQAARWRHQQRAPAGSSSRAAVPPVFQLPRVDEDLQEGDAGWMDGDGQGDGASGLGRGLQQLIMGGIGRLPGMGGGGGNGNGNGGAAAVDGMGGASGSAGAVAGPAAVRNRIAGMLDRERQD